MGSTRRPHLKWASGLVAQEMANERPALIRCNNRHSVLPLHGVSPPVYGQYCGRPRKSRLNNPISSSDGGHMSYSPPAAHRSQRVQKRREQTHSGSFLDRRSGYETDQPSASVVVRARPGPSSGSNAAHGSSSSDRKMSSLLQPPPAPMESSQRMHDKVASFLRDTFMEDRLNWNEFCRDRAHVGSLNDVTLLWFAQGRTDIWVGSRLSKHLNNKNYDFLVSRDTSSMRWELRMIGIGDVTRRSRL